MRRPVIAGNWKMYKTQAEARAFMAKLLPLVANSQHCEIVVAPPYTALAATAEAAKGSTITVAAQNAHWEKEGAFTGEVSMPMLVETGCQGVILGHSERRHLFHETNENIAKKVRAALDNNLRPDSLRRRTARTSAKTISPTPS